MRRGNIPQVDGPFIIDKSLSLILINRRVRILALFVKV
jgi:hypothetical protein